MTNEEFQISVVLSRQKVIIKSLSPYSNIQLRKFERTCKRTASAITVLNVPNLTFLDLFLLYGIRKVVSIQFLICYFVT
jgi:hypothetical protein